MLQTTIAGSLPKPAWLAEPEKLWAKWRLEGEDLERGKRDAVLVWLKEQEDAGVDVVVVDGSLDGRLTDFLIGAIEGSDAQVVVVQLDSGATLNGDLDALLDTIHAERG